MAVMTTPFASAAELMARVLGAEPYPFVLIEHPISSASRNQLALRARAASEECAGLLLRGT